MYRLTCPHCQNVMMVETDQLGTIIRCSHCKRRLKPSGAKLSNLSQEPVLAPSARPRPRRDEVSKKPEFRGEEEPADDLDEEASAHSTPPKSFGKRRKACKRLPRGLVLGGAATIVLILVAVAFVATQKLRPPWAKGNGAGKVGELRTFVGHTKGVLSVGFSGDALTILSAGDERTIRFWNVETGKELRHLECKFSSCVAFSPDAKHLLYDDWNIWKALVKGPNLLGDIVSLDTLSLWNVESGRQVHTFTKVLGGTTSVTFSLDGRRVLSGNWHFHKITQPADMAIKAAAVSEIRQDNLKGHRGSVHENISCLVILSDVVTGHEIRRFVGHDGLIYATAISSDGQRILSGAADGTFRLWDLGTGQEVRRFCDGKGIVKSATFSRDGRHALSCSFSGTARLWDVATGREIRTLEGRFRSVAFSPDCRRVLTGGHDGTVQLWDEKTGREMHRFEGHTDGVNSVVFSSDGGHALSGSQDKTVRLWQLPK